MNRVQTIKATMHICWLGAQIELAIFDETIIVWLSVQTALRESTEATGLSADKQCPLPSPSATTADVEVRLTETKEI